MANNRQKQTATQMRMRTAGRIRPGTIFLNSNTASDGSTFGVLFQLIDENQDLVAAKGLAGFCLHRNGDLDISPLLGSAETWRPFIVSGLGFDLVDASTGQELQN